LPPFKAYPFNGNIVHNGIMGNLREMTDNIAASVKR
ncbi:unnamed protein product, partial [marine sediment metagenome]